MKLTIDQKLKEIIPDFNVIAYTVSLHDNINALDKSTYTKNLLDNLSNKVLKMYDYNEVTKIPKLKETRDGYKRLGKDPSHTRPASEAILRRILKGNSLYILGDAVDLGNILSLDTMRSVCVVDLDCLVGNIVIKLGTINDSYEGINRGIINVSNLPIYTDEKGPFGCPTSDTLRTSVKETTRNLLVMIICFTKNELRDDEQKLIDIYQPIGNLTKLIIEE